MNMQAYEAPFGVVDMGSNGIRFGIVRALERHLPVAYEERAPISLFEAQGTTHVIPEDTIEQVLTSFLRFKSLCQDAQVNPSNVHVVATEATRIASNSDYFMQRIFDATGWKVTLLPKQDEALISAAGIVGSFYHVNGITMDLGGGSVEFSYVGTHKATDSTQSQNTFEVAKDPVSLPYGAVALKRRLAECETELDRAALYDEIVSQVKGVVSRLNIPSRLLNQDGYDLYLSGGGFRALGYLSMAEYGTDSSRPTERKKAKHKKRLTYPIPIINGYSISREQLLSVVNKHKDKKGGKAAKHLRTFRVSKRRAGQVPACCFLMSAIMSVFKVRRVNFSDGGVRQGLCFQMLPPEEQAKDPLLEGARSYASHSPHALSPAGFDAILTILRSAISDVYLDENHPLHLYRLLPAAIHLGNLTSHYPKETRAFVAFHMPLASGPLANVPGISHYERATLALLLAYRQGGEVIDPIFDTIQNIVGRKGIAVCKFVGRLMELIFAISPLNPGVGLLKSGISFSSVTDSDTTHEDTQTTTSDSSSQFSVDSVPAHENPVDHSRYYPHVRFRIRLPTDQHSHMLSAPAVMSIIESMDKKVNDKKFDLDEEQRAGLGETKLFSIDIA